MRYVNNECEEWFLRDGSGGCVRKSNCPRVGAGRGFRLFGDFDGCFGLDETKVFFVTGIQK